MNTRKRQESNLPESFPSDRFQGDGACRCPTLPRIRLRRGRESNSRRTFIPNRFRGDLTYRRANLSRFAQRRERGSNPPETLRPLPAFQAGGLANAQPLHGIIFEESHLETKTWSPYLSTRSRRGVLVAWLVAGGSRRDRFYFHQHMNGPGPRPRPSELHRAAMRRQPALNSKPGV